MVTTATHTQVITQRGQRRVILVLALAIALIGLDAFMIVGLLPNMATSSGFSPAIGGLLVTVYALLYAVTAPIFGSISDRLGRKPLIVLGLLVLALGTALTGLGNNLALLLVCRAVAGLGAGILQPGVLAMVGDTTSYETRGRAMGIILGSLIAGGTLGLPIGSFLAQLLSWHWAFLLAGLLASLMCVVCALALPVRARSAPGTVATGSLRQRVRVAFSHRQVFFALLATLLWFGGMQGIFANLGVFYVTSFHVQPGILGLLLLTAGLFGALGGAFGGRIVDRWGKERVIGIAGIGSTVLVLAFVLSGHVLLLALAMNIIWSMVFNTGQAALSALVSELQPSLRGLVLSLNTSAMYIGSTLFTALAALILQSGSGFLGVAIADVAGNLIVIAIAYTVLIRKAV
ncbi:MAG TPA: MFS transporter [Ktedonobacteraceae bacterium]